MKDHEIRIAIAESVGWTNCRYVEEINDVKGTPPPDWKGIRLQPWYDTINCRIVQPDEAWVPQYTRDLNAIHELENTLVEPGKTEYLNYLFYSSTFDNEWQQVHTTADQRAEAYLRSKRLWKEEA